MTYILGLDLSTTCTGVALVTLDGDLDDAWEIPTKAHWNLETRCRHIASEIGDTVDCYKFADIWVEAIGTRFIASAIALGRLRGHVEIALSGRQLGEVSPAQVKQHATGKGNADKAAMIAAAETRWHPRTFTDNEADAAWIADYGRTVFNEACEVTS